MHELSDQHFVTMLSPEERERVHDSACELGLYTAELAREAIRARGEGEADASVRTLIEVVNEAGREYNEATWAANVCARRYGYASYMKDEEFKRLLNMLGTCERMASRSRLKLEDCRSASEKMAGAPWFVVQTRRASSGATREARLTFRLRRSDLEKVERCARIGGMSQSAWVRMALLTYIDGGVGSETVVTTDVVVSMLMRAAIRWRTNHRQAVKSLSVVRDAQGRSRYLERGQADDVVARVRACTRQMESAWDLVVEMLGPLESTGLLRGVGLCRC